MAAWEDAPTASSSLSKGGWEDAPSSKGGWEEPPKPAQKEEQGTLGKLATSVLEHPLQTLPGAAEALVGGGVGMGVEAVSGLAGLATGAVGLLPGVDTTFKAGYERTKEALKPISDITAPETEVGKAASETLGMLPEAIHAAGGFAYEKTGSPFIGAATEAGLTAATFLVGGELGKKEHSSLKETAFKDKKTGEITSSGPKHDEAIKAAGTHEPGFLDEKGNFHTRKEAAKIAKETGQLPPDHKLELPEEGLHSGDMRTAGDSRFDLPKESVPVEYGTVMEGEKPATHPDGRPVIARHYKDENGKSIGITVDNEAARLSYEASTPDYHPWIKENFSNVEDYQKFILEHEQEHVRSPQRKGEDPVAYEKRVTGNVLDRLKKEKDPSNMDMGVPKNNKELEDTLYSSGKNREADRVESTQSLKSAEKAGVTPEMKNRWRDYAEGTSKELDQQELTLFNRFMKPVLEQRNRLIRYAQDKGWSVPTEMSPEIAGINIGRKMIPKQLSAWEKLKAGITESDQGGLNLNIEKKPGAAQERGLFVAEFPNGNRVVVQGKGNDIVQWNKGKVSSFKQGIAGDKGIKAGDKVGEATIKEATTAELEGHTPYRYNKDVLAVNLERVNELKDFVRSKQMVENIKQSPLFKEGSHVIDPKTEIPANYVMPKFIDKLPEFAGMAFEKKTAAIIEDFAKHYQPNTLTLVSGALIKNMMLNPLPHMANEAWHLYNARGISGWVTPAGIARFAKTGMPAIREVMTQGDQFRSMLRDGASLLSADVRNNPIQTKFMNRGMEEFIATAEGKSLAAKYGMKPVELYNAISSKSSQAMWVTRDAMYMQLINEKMLKGMNQKEAIAEVERHMPNYRIPTEVFKSRRLSEVLQNPNVTVFSRYHYGMLRSLGETAKDLTGKRGKEAFFEGADTAAAIAVALAVFYPMQDILARKLTGNENASIRRAGPYHPIVAISEIAKGEKDPQALLASLFTFNPALLGGAQLIADRKLYNGQPIYNPTDTPGMIAKDVANYATLQLPQFSTISKVSDSKKGGGFPQWAAQQLDIKAPTKQDVIAKEKIKRAKLVASKHRKWKQEHAK